MGQWIYKIQRYSFLGGKRRLGVVIHDKYPQSIIIAPCVLDFDFPIPILLIFSMFVLHHSILVREPL